jgi:F-type H+-transporting ATPase subunit a
MIESLNLFNFFSYSFFHILYYSERYLFFLWMFPITKLEKYILLVIILCFIFFFLSIINKYIIPHPMQAISEFFYEFIAVTVNQQAGKQSQKIFPLFFVLFLFILFSNLIGLVPFSFTVTAHIFHTFSLSLSIIIALTIIGFLKHKIKFLNLFVPSGAPSFLIPLLIIIEIISYVSRAFSLAIRLFANMMSGHTLLNIIASFAVIMLVVQFHKLSFGLMIHYISSIVPLIMISGIFFLELGIAFLQAYVFIVLVAIYLNDSFKGGH